MKQKIIIKLIFFFLLVFSIFLEFSYSDSIIIMLSSGFFSIVIKLIIKPFLMKKILEKIDKKEELEERRDAPDKKE